MSQLHYVFRDDRVFAIHQGKVIASSTDADECQRLAKVAFDGFEGPGEVEHDPGYGEQRAMHDPYAAHICQHCGAEYQDPDGHTPCPHCGQVDAPTQDMNAPGGFAEELGAGLGMRAQVTTPNGLKGTVLGKVAGLWGEEVTVRLENGRIVKLPTNTTLQTHKTASTAATKPIAQLEARLASTPDGTRASLEARSQDLGRIHQGAANLIRDGVSHADSIRLDQIVVAAEVENRSVIEAIAHLDDVESYSPPISMVAAATETAGISREDASTWLDHAVVQMIKQAEATDFTKLMDEGPEALTAEASDNALADPEVTREIASNFIGEKTAGIERTIAEPYMTKFLARVEDCREAELGSRQQTISKQAAVQDAEYGDFPDDALFL